MESMFLWIVLFSAAAVLLLGLFLVASEKELKKKRGEVKDLLIRLEGASTAFTAPAGTHSAGNGAEDADLRARHQELKKELALSQDDLAAAQRAIEELRAEAAADGATLAGIDQLRFANSELEAQVEDLRRQLQAGETQLNHAGATDSDASARQTQLENALIDLKLQLEKSQAQVRELERATLPAVDTGAIEAGHREESLKLQARIAELEKDLSAGVETRRQLDTLQQRLHESETLERELRDTLQRREDEIPHWQEQIAASEAIEQRLLALQPVYDQLVAKQSSLIDHQRSYHDELKSFAQFLSACHDGTTAAPSFSGRQGEAETPLAKTSTPAVAPYDGNDGSLAAPSAALDQIAGNKDLEHQAKRGFGIFHALMALVMCGAMAALFWTQRGEQPVTHAAKPLPLAAPREKAAPKPIVQTVVPANKPVALATPIDQAGEAPAAQPAKQSNIPQAAPVGTYEVIRSTPVYAAPTEFARQLGEIEPGLKLNVVNGRDGWLEIHSKHGRPPGYIRGDAATRVGG